VVSLRVPDRLGQVTQVMAITGGSGKITKSA
jgi:hypothetical protein